MFARGNPVYLYVQASAGNHLLSYQWYRNTKESASGAVKVGENSSNLVDRTAASLSAGTYYYYAEVTDASAASAPVRSSFAQVKIVNKGAITSSLQNGDFQDVSGVTVTGGAPSGLYRTITGLPGWQTTHGDHTMDGKKYEHETEIQDASYYPGNGTQKQGSGDPLGAGINRAVELSAYYQSSIFQEVATVPGSIYSWSLKHLPHSATGTPEVVAVVMGPAFEGSWSESQKKNGYPYGVSLEKTDNSFFRMIAQKVATENNKSIESLSGDYTTEYNGGTYYVSIVSSNGQFRWFDHSGVYSVPEGQGVTVFGFAGLKSKASNLGNVMDDIVFAQGTPASIDADVDYSGGGQAVVASASTGFRYGVVEERGSTTIPVSNLAVTSNGVSVSESNPAAGSSGWYAPKANGERLVFGNLTPGKTYRIVAVPTGAISATQKANLLPSLVLDSTYYKTVTIKAVSDGSNGSGGNIQATAEATADGKARIIVKPARDDVEYALLQTDGSKLPLPGRVQTAWTSPAAGAGSLMFDQLNLETSYAIVARAKGYDEVTYQKQVEAKSYVVVKTPSKDFRDVAAGDGSVSRSDDGSSITIVNKGNREQWYMVYDAATGVAVTDAQHADGWRSIEGNNNKSITVPVDGSTAYQIVAKEQGAAPSPGIRSYGLVSALDIDYVNETAGTGGIVPKTIEYRIKDDDASKANPWYAGDETSWVAGSGGSALSLSTVLDQTVQGATLTCRAKADYEPAIAVESTRAIVPRGVAPQRGSGFAVDYASETVSAGTSGAAVQVRAGQSSAWIDCASGARVPFSKLGWVGTGGTFDVRFSAVAASGAQAFASHVAEGVALAARPAVPTAGAGGVMLTVKDASTSTLAGVDARMEYSLDSGANWKVGSAAGVQDVPVGKKGSLLVRVKATQNTPASLPLEMSPTSLYVVASGSFASSLTYGYDAAGASKAAATLAIKNSSVSGTLKVTKVSLTGTGFTLSGNGKTGVQELSFSPARQLAVGDSLNDVSIVPNQGLAAGAHEARVTVTYTDESGATEFTTTATLVLSVGKAAQPAPSAIEATSQTAENLVVRATAATAVTSSGKMEFSEDGGSSWKPSVGVSGGAASATFAGLSPATVYSVSARMAADDNHEASPACGPVAFATAHAAPVAANCALDYYGETASFGTDFEACTDGADPAGTAYSSGSALAPLLEGAGSTLLMRHRATTAAAPAAAGGGDVDVPASDWLSIPLIRPSISASTTMTNADDSRTANGTLSVSGASSFQYRKQGAANWVTVSGSKMNGLAAGTYEVRAPATGTAFASTPTTAVVAAKYCFLTFHLAGGEGSAPAEQRVAVGKAAASVNVPSRTGYTFLSWHASNDGGATLATEAWDPADLVASDHDLYAKWKANAYTVEYKANAPAGAVANGSMATELRAYNDGGKLAANAFAIPNWEFTGWNTQADGNGVSYDDTAAGNLASNDGATLTLYAQWKRPAMRADVPVKAAVRVSPSGAFTCPEPWTEAAGAGYCIESTTQATLKVSSIEFKLASGAQGIFSKASDMAVAVNGASIPQGSVVSVDGNAFKLAASDGASVVRLPLTLGLSYPGGTMAYSSEARDFATIVYKLSFDDGAASAVSPVGEGA